MVKLPDVVVKHSMLILQALVGILGYYNLLAIMHSIVKVNVIYRILDIGLPQSHTIILVSYHNAARQKS